MGFHTVGGVNAASYTEEGYKKEKNTSCSFKKERVKTLSFYFKQY